MSFLMALDIESALFMEIGDKIIFLKNGVLAWEGNSDLVFRTDNQAVTEFVYSSELFKKVREATRAQSK